MDLFEALHTQRAIRSFKPDPVPDDLLHKVLDAAIRAPSGGNSQQWAFLVLKDPKVKRRIGAIYREIFTRHWHARHGQRPRPLQSKGLPHGHRACAAHGSGARPHRGVCAQDRLLLPRHGGLVYLSCGPEPDARRRGLGLGTVITTVHRLREAEIKEILGVPDEMDTAALVPLGFPADGVRFGPTNRRPVEEVAFLDHWGTPVFPGAQPD